LARAYFLTTAGQRLSFEGALVLQAPLDGPDGSDEPELTDPSLALSYAVFTRATEISVDLSYSALDLDDRELDEDFDADDLTEDGGRRERIAARVGLVTGRDRALRHRDGAHLTATTASAMARPMMTRPSSAWARPCASPSIPAITLRATGFLSQEDTDDALETFETVHSYGLGADLLISRLWTANIDFGYRETETETLAPSRGSSRAAPPRFC
jgi:hypothetical protein